MNEHESCSMNIALTLCHQDYGAVIFDLDGVLTNTAQLHASAWKKVFDNFLLQTAQNKGTPFIPFDTDMDYLVYLDGKPHYDGASAFLKSRGINLPWGSPEDGPDVQSICGLGNLKDSYFISHLQQKVIEVYESSVALVR